MMMKRQADKLTRKAYAKINLGLDVVGRLENGYHQVRMIMQTVGIYDRLTFAAGESGIRIVTDSGELPTGPDNLIYRAAVLLLETCGVEAGVDIRLEKHIPIAAGMAGGSSDAAATLQGLNDLFALGLTQERLRQLGVRIGADVPYCIMGGTALAEGIGEVLTPLPPAPRCTVLVAKPDLRCPPNMSMSIWTQESPGSIRILTACGQPSKAAVFQGWSAVWAMCWRQ